MARYHCRPKQQAKNCVDLETKFKDLSNPTECAEQTQHGTGNESRKISPYGSDASNREGKAEQAYED